MATYVIHIGKVKLEYDTPEVKASTILEQAGAEPPSDYILEATQGEGGKVQEQFSGDQLVDVAKHHHFRFVPKGGGRADGQF